MILEDRSERSVQKMDVDDSGETTVKRTGIALRRSVIKTILKINPDQLNNGQLLEALAEKLCDPIHTMDVAAKANSLLLELLTRASQSQSKPAFLIALSKLVGHYSVATHFWTQWTSSDGSLFKLPLVEPMASRKKLKTFVNSEAILEACLSLLWLNTANFVEQCDWTPITNFTDKGSDESRWLALNCVRLINNLSEREFNKMVSNLFSIEKQSELRIKFSYIFETRNRLVSEPNQDNDPTDFIIFDEADFSTSIVPVCGVLLNKFQNESSTLKDIVLVDSFEKCLRKLAIAVANCDPVVIEGPVGTGKSCLVEYLATKTGRTNAPQLMKVQLSDQIDSKLLIGSHCCTEIPGDFVWRAGPLTDAMNNGYWLLFEDIDCASPDVITTLTAAIKSRSLASLPGSNSTGAAHSQFRMFFTRRLAGTHSEFINRSAQSELDKFCERITLNNLNRAELSTIILTNWRNLEPILPRLLDVYEILTTNKEEFDSEIRSGTSRQVSLRDLTKWCHRLSKYFKLNANETSQFAFLDAADCFYQNFPEPSSRLSRAIALGTHLNITKLEAEHLIRKHRPDVKVTEQRFTVGRAQLDRNRTDRLNRTEPHKSCFAYTQQSLALLERICISVAHKEPVLLVGETGTGKTSTVQYLAQTLGHQLTVVNMNQQSDSCDLLGGYKPVDFAVVVMPLRREFETLFVESFDPQENAKFLSNVNACFQQKKWDTLLSLMRQVGQRALHKKRQKNSDQWKDLIERLNQLHQKCKLDEKRYLVAFAYIEGSLVRAMQQGHWILLDEINLAEPETLQCLSSVLDGDEGSILLLDKADGKPIKRHSNFRLFACMNPATDVGKKELPLGIRNRFTELFVDELESRADLQVLVSSYLDRQGVPRAKINRIIDFYLKAKQESKANLSDTTGHRPHYSLRTLCRALMVSARRPCGDFSRSLYEAFCLSFLTQLDNKSRVAVEKLITQLLLGDENAASIKGADIPKLKERQLCFEGFWIDQGDLEPAVDTRYILTKSVRNNLKDLARIISIGNKFPVLIQGETSVGKTSLIQWLAAATGNKCVRLNNHEHTDLQEYVGSYVSDGSGKLVFKEGILVEAMRHGYWIILDELNLAPTEVLEALNRVLDDNRELFITETQSVVKAHPKFLLFATQNPPGHYGGRKVLSRAFRNRFIELHFDEIPHVELEDILHRRCALPKSYAKKMVNVLTDLQLRRRESGVFAGKQGFITLRDLFRWGERYRISANAIQDRFFDWETHVAVQGYMILAGRVRRSEEAELVKEVLESNFRRKLDLAKYFTEAHQNIIADPHFDQVLKSKFPHLVWTTELKRLVVLLWDSLKYVEPVLLVGETGCGKTTVCQLYAAMRDLKLYAVNCHMHSEGSDFLGSLRPVREKSDDETRLFEWVDGPLVNAMREGAVFLVDEISLADDSVLERLNSVLEPERKLLLAEKGSDNADTELELAALDSFRLVATMNPGGDYGKKELSLALRNRFTEIWCPITTELEDIAAIIKHNLCEQLKLRQDQIAKIICEFYAWFRDEISQKKNVSSVRDILAWVQFINLVSGSNSIRRLSLTEALIHGAQLVFIDSVGCGGFLASEEANRAKRISATCISQLRSLVQILLKEESYDQSMDLDGYFGIEPFYIETSKSSTIQSVDYSFSADGPKTNCLKILRAMQLAKPILMEGVPGVGKTSLVQALAKSTGHDLVRINLSEQTDISDLFGGDLPVEGDDVGGKFAWRDGPLLQALKSDNCWILLDELNLASQSVLEGLNACLDHRGEIFVAELAKTFTVNKDNTRIFACQNPYGQGGARKGLPKSFLNRFTVCYVDAFTSDDFLFITQQMFPTIPSMLLLKMIQFNQSLINAIAKSSDGFAKRGAPWELNLRDIFRWCHLIVDYYGERSVEMSCDQFVEIIFLNRFRTQQDRDQVLSIFQEVFGHPLQLSVDALQVRPSTIQIGNVIFERSACDLNEKNFEVLHWQLASLKALLTTIKMNWLSIIVGPSGVGKTALAHLLGQLAGREIKTLTISSEMDTIELLGSFEKKDYNRHFLNLERSVWAELRNQNRQLLNQSNFNESQQLGEIWIDHIRRCRQIQADHLNEVKQFTERLNSLLNVTQRLSMAEHQQLAQQLINKVANCKSLSGGGNFEWVDSQLLRSIKAGDWLLIDDVNLCSSSVLDRLNGLLEPQGQLVMTEQGVVNESIPVITPHPNFRLMMTMDPRNGELSRAMRNRGVEICILPPTANDRRDLDLLLQSVGLTSPAIRKVLLELHLQLLDRSEFATQELNPGHLLQAAKQYLNDQQITSEPNHKTGKLCDAISSQILERAIHGVYRHFALDETGLAAFNELVNDHLAQLQAEATAEQRHIQQSLIKMDPRKVIGDSIACNAQGDLQSLQSAFELTATTGEQSMDIDESTQPTDQNAINAALLMKIYLALSSSSDQRIRKILIESIGDYHSLIQIEETIKRVMEVVGPDVYNQHRLDEQPVDIRQNRKLWERLYPSDGKTIVGTYQELQGCLNRFLIQIYWAHLHSITVSTSSSRHCYILSAEFNEGRLTRKQLPAPFVSNVKELIDRLDTELINDGVLQHLTMADDDQLFAIQEMLSWIGDLYRFCHGPVGTIRDQTLTERFVVLWTLTNQFGIDRLRSALIPYRIDLDELIKKVNETVNIDIIEHRKGWTRLVASIGSQLFHCHDAESASLWARLLDLIQLWQSLSKKLHYKEFQRQLYSIANRLINTKSLQDTSNLSLLENDLKILEHNIRTLLVPKNEDEEENDTELLEKIKERSLLIEKEILPFYQLIFCLQERSLLGGHGGNVSTVSLEKMMPVLNPLHQLLISNQKEAKCDQILYHLMDTDQQLTAEKLFDQLSKDYNQHYGNDNVQENLWPSLSTIETTPLFTFILTCLLNSQLFSLGTMQLKQQQLRTVQSDLWHNFTQLTSSGAIDPIAASKDLVARCMNEIESSLTDVQADNDDVKNLLKKSNLALNNDKHPDTISIGTAEVYMGMAWSRLLQPVNTIDPVERKACKLSHYEHQLRLVNQELKMRNRLSLIATGHPMQQGPDGHEHPHVVLLQTLQEELKQKITKLSDQSSHRPLPSQYLKLRNQIKQFMATQLDPISIEQLLSCCTTGNVDGTTTRTSTPSIIAQLKRLIASLATFIRQTMSYNLYWDLTAPFCTGLALIRHGLQLLAADLQARAHRFDHAYVSSTCRLLNESLRFPRTDLLASVEPLFQQPQLQAELIECFGLLRSRHLNSSLLLRSALMDLQAQLQLTTRNRPTTVASFDKIMAQFVRSWQQATDAQRQAQQELEASFEFRSRTHCPTELNESDQDAVDIAEKFPSYREAFSDLLNDNLMETEMATDSTPANTQSTATIEESLVITDDATLDIISTHENIINLLSTNDSPPNTSKSSPATIDLGQARALRYSVLCELLERFGPALTIGQRRESGTAHLDQQGLVAVHLMRAASLIRLSDDQPSDRSTRLNVYQDHCADELPSLLAVLERIERRIVNQLLPEWPGQPTLTKLLRLIDRIEQFSVQSPLIKFITGAELILDEAQHWQKSAHKGIKLTAELDELTALVIKWRKMEIGHWSSCLDSVCTKLDREQKCQYWFHFYQLFQQLLDHPTTAGTTDADDESHQQNLKEFVVSLKQFMEAATLGTYGSRLSMLNTFSRHARLVGGQASRLHCGLENVHRFYNQFEPEIAERVRTVREPIEKELREFVKIQTYRDVNYFSVKAAIDKTHRTLHKSMKKFETALGQPVRALLNVTEATTGQRSQLMSSGIDHRHYLVQTSISSELGHCFADVTLSSAGNFVTKMRSLCRKTMKSCSRYEDGIVDVNEMSDEIIRNVKELQQLQVGPGVTDKTKWRQAAHHIHNRKRKALNDLFKRLAEHGLRYRKGLVEAGEYSIDDVLLLTGSLPIHHINTDDHHNQLYNGVNRYFNSSLARYAALSRRLESGPSKELTMSNIERIKGFSTVLLKSIIEHRKLLSIHLFHSDTLKARFDEIFAPSTTASHYEDRRLIRQQSAALDWINSIRAIVERTVLLLIEIEQFVKCKPDSSPECILNFASDDQEPLDGAGANCDQLLSLVQRYLEPMHRIARANIGSLVFEADINNCIDTFKLLEQFSEAVAQIHFSAASPISTALQNLCAHIGHEKNAFDRFVTAQTVQTPTQGQFEESNRLIVCTMVAVENLYKNYGDLDETKQFNVANIVSVADVWSALQMSKANELLSELIEHTRHCCEQGYQAEASALLSTCRPFVEQYIKLSDYFVHMATAALHVDCKLLHVLLGLFGELVTNGFCLPPELDDEQQGDQQHGADEKFRDISDGGLGEGEGSKDVSKNISSEDQLEDTLRTGAEQEERKDADNKERKDEDDGVEMSEDFDGQAYDPEPSNDQDGSSSESDEDPEEPDDQMGDLDKAEQTYDKQIWGDDNEKDRNDSDSELSDMENDQTNGEPIGDNQMVANEENAGLKNGDDRDADRNEPEHDQHDEFDEVNEQNQKDQYEGEHEDPYKSRDPDQDPGKDRDNLELPEDMRLDGDESDSERNDGEDGPEQDDSVQAEKDQPEEMDEGFKEVEQSEPDKPEDRDGNRDKAEPDDTDGADGEETNDPKQTEESHEHKPDEELPSEEGLTEDQSATEELQALAAKDFATSKDNVQTVPEDHNPDQTSSDMANANEQDEQQGVGKAQIGQNTEGHEGVAEARRQMETDQEPETFRPQPKHQNADKRSLAESDQKQSAKRQKVLDNDEADADDGADQQPERREPGQTSALYQHVEADQEADDEVIDTAAEEEARRSRPNRELESAPEPDDQDDIIPDDDEPELRNNEDELRKTLESMKLKTETSNGKNEPNKSKAVTDSQDDEQDLLTMEGDFIETSTVQRAPETTYHTRTEQPVTAKPDPDWILRLQPPITSGSGDGKVPLDQATAAWDECCRVVNPLVFELCEQLQLVLEPTKSARLKGDYRSGKRINMRKVVAYIASQFRKDKIWLKRNKPSKRQYQILLAVDDSMSMADNQSKKLAFESLALLSKSLTLLEAGELGVMSFGEQVKLLHPFAESFTESSGARMLTDFTFEQRETRYANLLESACSAMLMSQRAASKRSAAEISQLLLIISDGRNVCSQGEQMVRQRIGALRDAGIFVVFVVIDNPKNKDSIFDIRTPRFIDSGVKMESYMENFPFPFYVVLRDINQMPVVLGEALRQWFELVTTTDR